MSSSLYWRPDRNKGHLPDAIKQKLEHNSFPLTMDESDLQYLKGLADCDVDGAVKLIGLINKHGAIILNIEY